MIIMNYKVLKAVNLNIYFLVYEIWIGFVCMGWVVQYYDKAHF